MKTPTVLIGLMLLFFSGFGLCGDWPAFRGPTGDGISFERGVPLKWSATENLAWAVELEAPGNSSPIVWGDRVIITAATEIGRKRWTICYHRDTGKELWRQAVAYDSAEPTHQTNPFCSATPVTDGKRIYAWHGSAGVVAYDMEGRELWRNDLGLFYHIWGNAASPVLFEDTLILSAGPGPNSMLVALNIETGQIVWKHTLPEAATKKSDEWKGSWATPVFSENSDGRAELILPLPQYVAGFNPHTGQEYWRCTGLSDLAYSSAAVGRDVIVAMSGYQGPAIGVRRPGPEGKGNITATHQLWRVEKNPQRIGTGVIIGDHLYMVNEPGIAECIETKTGNSVWKERLGGATWGSIIYADAKLYATDSNGTTFVFEPKTTFKLLSKNELASAEVTRATPAFSDGQVFIRTHQKLYCFGTRRK